MIINHTSPHSSIPCYANLPTSMPLRMSQKEVDRLHRNLAGGLPFPTPEGRKQPARPLRLRKSALSPAQAKSESSHGQSLIVWLKSWERLCPAFARTFHVANEHNGNDKKEYTRADGKRGVYSSSAMRRKAEGVRPGIFDYFNLARQRGFSGLVFDLKVRDGELISAPDKEWDQVRERVWLHSQGFADHVCWSWAEAAALHAWYFGITQSELLRSIGRLDMWLIPELGGHDARCGCDVNLHEFLKQS